MMAGDGTLGLELVEDVPEVTDVLISVGGGGLITGVGTVIHGLSPEVRIVVAYESMLFHCPGSHDEDIVSCRYG
jgi:threonine dehydratase